MSSMGSLKLVLKVESTHETFVNDVTTRDQKKVNDIWDHVQYIFPNNVILVSSYKRSQICLMKRHEDVQLLHTW